MKVAVIMPELGESIVEGTIVRWLKQEGEAVKEDEPLVEIMTDKVNTELPAPASGILRQVLAPAGATVQVGQELAYIETEVSATAEAPMPQTPAAEAALSEPSTPPPVSAVGFYSGEAEPTPVAPPPAPKPATPPRTDGQTRSGRPFISPVVSKIAQEHGISLEELLSIPGTGTGGRITRKDVEAYLARRAAQPQSAPQPTAPAVAPQPAPAVAPTPTTPAPPREGEEIIPLVGMRKAIAEHLTKSYQTAVHVTTVIQVDVSKLVEFRERNKESFQQQYGVRLTYTPFFVKACADALLEFPMLNATLQDDQIIVRHYVHMGVAVALGEKGEEGLIVPVIRDAHKKSLIEIARELEDLATRARNKTITVADVQGATFTLTNPGSYGALIGTPIINYPQTAILGTYAIVKQPVVINDMIAIRPMMYLCLSYDHRIIDGMYAGRFLQRIKRAIEEFEFFR
ncbi:MAG: 2-oxo acid dehydrogenase subunit E2 [Fimbriimonadales bacterium]|nr:2-oxo acid dehydrogenase subunit E2 [Fimbriimonadales bacterium]MDW8051480.1 dihydrolipoamide acetyltransferase family protein [Armatimonadota bacterium]